LAQLSGISNKHPSNAITSSTYSSNSDCISDYKEKAKQYLDQNQVDKTIKVYRKELLPFLLENHARDDEQIATCYRRYQPFLPTRASANSFLPVQKIGSESQNFCQLAKFCYNWQRVSWFSANWQKWWCKGGVGWVGVGVGEGGWVGGVRVRVGGWGEGG
jgi:hypothetical protein